MDESYYRKIEARIIPFFRLYFKFFCILLLVTVSSIYVIQAFFYLYLHGFDMMDLRFFAHKIVPIIFFTLFIFQIRTRILNFLSKLMILSVVAIFSKMLYGIAMGIPFYDYVGFRWRYMAAIEWIVAFLFAYIIFYKRTQDNYASVNFAVQSVSAGGWLYEIPVWHKETMFFHPSYPFYINTQILSIFFIIYTVKRFNWKPTRYFIATLTVYIVFSVIYHFMEKSIPYAIPRLPTIVMLLTLPTGIEDRSKNF